MKRIVIVATAVLAVLFASHAFAPSANAVAPTPGSDEVVLNLTFAGPDDVFVFDVQAAQGAGVLTVDTADCCILGDIWRVDLSHSQSAGADTATGIGDGSTAFSGAASRNGWSKGTVTVSYDSGVDVWPAGMTVRFRASSNGSGEANGNTGIVVTQISP